MDNLRYKLQDFMRGRYGPDQLYQASLGLCFFLIIVNLFIQSTAISIIVWIVFMLMSYRALSKNIYKRQMENNQFLQFTKPIKKNFSLTIRRFKEIRTHRFRKCPHCKTTLRLKRKKGKHSVTCPRCKNKVDVHFLF